MASTHDQINYKNDKPETVVKRVPSYDEDIVNQLETFGYATRTELIKASYKCIDYKDPNEVIQCIDDEQSNSIHIYEHDCINITSNINNNNTKLNIISPSPSPPPGPPPPLYHNKRHILQFPQTQNDIYPCPNIIIQEWSDESTVDESQPPLPTNPSVPDFKQEDERNNSSKPLQYKNIISEIAHEHYEQETNMNNVSDGVQSYTVIRDKYNTSQQLVKKNTGSRSKLLPIALELPPFLQLMESLSYEMEEDDAPHTVELTNHLYKKNMYKFIEVYVQKMNPAVTVKVVAALLDLDCPDWQVQSLMVGIAPESISIKELIVEVEKHSRLSILLPWLENNSNKYSNDLTLCNALVKLYLNISGTTKNSNYWKTLHRNAHKRKNISLKQQRKLCKNRPNKTKRFSYHRW